MLRTNIKRRLMLTTLGLAMALAMTNWITTKTSAQQQPAAGATEQLMEQKYKNIQVLKGLPAAQMHQVMTLISASLGVTCAKCHVRTGNDWEFDKDDKGEKKTARMMIQMTMDINKGHFGGRNQVTCFTCHHGHDHPVSVPPLPIAPPAADMARSTDAPPTAEQILGKYTQAVGGKEAVEKLKNTAFKGTQAGANGPAAPLELQTAGADKLVSMVTMGQGAVISQGLNGNAAWQKNPREQRAMDSIEITRLKSLAMSLDPLQLREPYPRLGFGGKDKIGDREVVILRGQLPDKRRVRYFFDAQSGLLLRRLIIADAVIGLEPEQTDYEDYREVDGVKIPFTIRTSSTDGFINATRKFTEVKHHVTIDDSVFNPPAPKP